MNKEQFKTYLKELNIDITQEQEELLEIYKNFLIEYNTHTNLTSITKENDIYLKHFYDSLVLSKYIKPNTKVLDIGTGAGFPGLVLAIFNQETNFYLLDSNNKKIKFLEELIKKLNLTNVTLINERAEDYVRLHKEEFDITTSRAVAHLRILTELSLPSLKINGLFIPLKSNIEEELKESLNTLKKLNGEIIEQINYNLPIENSKRTILVIKHTKKTDDLYPRQYNKILKNSL